MGEGGKDALRVGFDGSLKLEPACWQAGRSEGGDARSVRDLPDGRGRRAPMGLPGDPRTDSAAQAEGDGTRMIAAHDEMAGGCGGEGDGLPEGAANARMEAVSGRITVRWQANAPFAEPAKSLRMSGTVVGSSARPTTVVSATPSGKS